MVQLGRVFDVGIGRLSIFPPDFWPMKMGLPTGFGPPTGFGIGR